MPRKNAKTKIIHVRLLDEWFGPNGTALRVMSSDDGFVMLTMDTHTAFTFSAKSAARLALALVRFAGLPEMEKANELAEAARDERRRKDSAPKPKPDG